MSAAYLLPAEQGVPMSQFFQIHPDNPQPRLIKQAVDIIRKAKVQPREYKKQASALLKWVQDPKNIFYVKYSRF